MDAKISDIKYIILDIDGTLTDGGIYYDDKGNELKKFNVKDAAGFFYCRKVGIKIVVVTGRESHSTLRRMQDMNVDSLFQGVKNKFDFLKAYLEENKIKKEEVLYIGDDLNDVKAMRLVKFIACPQNSCSQILNMANVVSKKSGGDGAFRDILEQIFYESWDSTMNVIYEMGN